MKQKAGESATLKIERFKLIAWLLFLMSLPAYLIGIFLTLPWGAIFIVLAIGLDSVSSAYFYLVFGTDNPSLNWKKVVALLIGFWLILALILLAAYLIR